MMRRLRRLLSLAAMAGAVAPPALADTVHDEQLWINLTGQGTIGRDGIYFLELQPRIGEGASRLDQFLFRGAVGLRVADGLTLQQGYARVRTTVSGRPDTTENRSFQQIGWNIGQIAGGPLSSRTRIEQRWLSTGNDMGWRLREMLRLSVPLRKGGNGVAFLTSAEGFFALNDTDWGARAGFDRLRAFAGLEVPIGGKSTIEVGYLNQTVNERGGTSMDHAASISVFLRR